MTSTTTPKPKGIPNVVGNGCWFASISQTIFRQDSLRNAFNEFQSKGIKFDRQKDFEHALDLLHKYFDDIAGPYEDFSNKDLLHALPFNDGWLFRGGGTAGKESTMGLTSFLQLFSALAGDKKINIHSFATPLSDCLSIINKDNGKRIISSIIQIENCDTISEAFKKQFDQLAYLPRYLILEANQRWEPYFKIEEDFTVPEPIEYLAMNNDFSKCKSKVNYSIIAIILYHGSDASHATAVVRAGIHNKWYHYNDSNVRQVDDPSSVFEDNKWPKVFVYEKNE